MPHKFSHIKSLKDLDEEILKTQLKKEIIKEDISLRVSTVREMLKPASATWQLIRLFLPRKGGKTPSSILIELASEIVTTVKASNYGFKLVKKLFN